MDWQIRTAIWKGSCMQNIVKKANRFPDKSYTLSPMQRYYDITNFVFKSPLGQILCCCCCFFFFFYFIFILAFSPPTRAIFSCNNSNFWRRQSRIWLNSTRWKLDSKLVSPSAEIANCRRNCEEQRIMALSILPVRTMSHSSLPGNTLFLHCISLDLSIAHLWSARLCQTYSELIPGIRRMCYHRNHLWNVIIMFPKKSARRKIWNRAQGYFEFRFRLKGIHLSRSSLNQYEY